jgi:hypothetical protein
MAKNPRNQDHDSNLPAGQPPADDGGADPAHVPTQEEKDADKPPFSKEEAEQLLRSGHRLRVKGTDPSNWIAMSRHGGDMAVSYAATDDELDVVLSQALILADQ